MEKLKQRFKENKIIIKKEYQCPYDNFIEAPSPLREHKIINRKTSFCINSLLKAHLTLPLPVSLRLVHGYLVTSVYLHQPFSSVV